MTQNHDAGCAKIKLSKHAEARAQQRGIRRDIIDFILEHADRSLHAGEGLRSVSISRQNQRRLSRNGFDPQIIDRTDGVALLIDPNENCVVTIMRLHGRQARRYLRQHATRSAKRSVQSVGRAA